MHCKRQEAALALICLLLMAAASPVRSDEIDDFLCAEMRKQHIPGMSLAVVKEGKIVKAEGYGLANVELDVAARPETVYKIGSVSKQLIAAGIMLLVEDGKVGLDDTMARYLKDTPEAWQAITIRHLLSHTSGIVREAPGFSPFQVQGDAAVIRSAYDLPLRFAPGEKWQYCNVGYFALAEIIHQVTGKAWDAFLDERIFAPLEMRATRATTASQIVPHRANGYVWLDKQHLNAPNYLAVRPSGAFLSSVLDLARWDAALYSDRVLKRSSREGMVTPVVLNDGSHHLYGFGWSLEPLGGHRQMHHGGSISGFRSELARLVDDQLTIIVLTNSESAKPAALAAAVAKHYVPGLLPEAAGSAAD